MKEEIKEIVNIYSYFINTPLAPFQRGYGIGIINKNILTIAPKNVLNPVFDIFVHSEQMNSQKKKDIFNEIINYMATTDNLTVEPMLYFKTQKTKTEVIIISAKAISYEYIGYSVEYEKPKEFEKDLLTNCKTSKEVYTRFFKRNIINANIYGKARRKHLATQLPIWHNKDVYIYDCIYKMWIFIPKSTIISKKGE